MGKDETTPWPQTIVGALTINGVVTAVVSVGTTWVINNAAKLPWLLIAVTFLVVGAVVFLLVSLFLKRLRELIWCRPLRWVSGLRVSTAERRRELVQEGYDIRSAEVAKERSRVGRPVWRISFPNRASGFGNYYWLNNHGAGVSDVSLTCDRALFILHEEVVFNGPMTPGTGKQFAGELTELGRVEGVVFTVAWRDENGDSDSREVPLTPEGIREARDQAFEEARIDGLVQGRREGRAALQAEIDAQRRQPFTRAQWLIHEKRDAQYTWELVNVARGSTARGVSVDVDSAYFRTASALDWAEVNGGDSVEFVGARTEGGRSFGVSVRVSWIDANDEDQIGYVQIPSNRGL